jgi:hypothetical protein
MSVLQSFFCLASQAVGHPLFLVPAAVCAAGAMWLAGSRSYQWSRVRKREVLQLALPGLIALGILFCGALFAADRFHPSEMGSRLIGWLFLLEFPLVVGLVIRFRAVRGLALLVILPQVWLAAWAFFVSGMSVSGVWL